MGAKKRSERGEENTTKNAITSGYTFGRTVSSDRSIVDACYCSESAAAVVCVAVPTTRLKKT